MLISSRRAVRSSRQDVQGWSAQAPRPHKTHPTAGYLIRRCRQLGLALFAEEAGGLGVTTQQYTILRVLAEAPYVEQTALCEVTALDRSTTASLLDRLERLNLARRTPSPQNRRRNLISITLEGRKLLRRTAPVVRRSEARFLAPLSGRERATFLRLLRLLVEHHEAAIGVGSRARRKR